jgi:hypothetical protein
MNFFKFYWVVKVLTDVHFLYEARYFGHRFNMPIQLQKIAFNS